MIGAIVGAAVLGVAAPSRHCRPRRHPEGRWWWRRRRSRCLV